MHAAVRHLIKARNELTPGMWHPDWGTPINQEDLAGTRMSFSYVFSDPMRRLGVRVPAEDVEAYLHLWNVIGHLLGLRDELLVRDIDDATALVDTIRRRQFEASPEGQELTRALLDLMDELTPVHRLDDTIPPLIRHLIGDETADLLLVPKSDRTDDLGPLARIAKWFFVHVLGQVERDLPRYQLASRMAAPFGRDLLDAGFNWSGWRAGAVRHTRSPCLELGHGGLRAGVRSRRIWSSRLRVTAPPQPSHAGGHDGHDHSPRPHRITAGAAEPVAVLAPADGGKAVRYRSRADAGLGRIGDPKCAGAPVGHAAAGVCLIPAGCP